jgi:hypothetical protein
MPMALQHHAAKFGMMPSSYTPVQQPRHKSVTTIPALTGIRFYLAAFVVVFHFGQEGLSRFPRW